MTLFRLAWRNVLRNKTRLLLTTAGVAIAVMTFVTLRTALGSWDRASEVARKDRLFTRQKLTFVMPLPKRYVSELRDAKDDHGEPLVRAVTWASWFGGRDPARENDFFATMAIDADTYFDVFDELVVPPDQLDAFRKDRNGAIVGEVLARQMGWHVGDRVNLKSPIYPTADDAPWTFTVRAIYATNGTAFDKKSLYFHWQRLDETLSPRMRGMVGTLVSRATHPERAVDTATAIDRLFEGREVQTLTQDERAYGTGFMGMISAVLDVVSVLSIVVLLILGLVLANAIGMGVRERTREYAALRAIGFRPKHVAFVVVMESALVALLGGVVGVVSSALFVDRGLGRFFEENLSSLFPIFRAEPVTLALALVIACGLGAVAAIVPAFSVAAEPTTGALRRSA